MKTESSRFESGRQRAATKAFVKQATAIDSLIEQIQTSVLEYGDCRNATWPQVGSLEYVRELLQQAADHLTGKSN